MYAKSPPRPVCAHILVFAYTGCSKDAAPIVSEDFSSDRFGGVVTDEVRDCLSAIMTIR
jgi:hypothetical protein